MDRMILELKGQEKKTLYIIGNGFDLYHGLKTSYHDFRDWLIKHNCYDFVSDMEKMFPKMSGNKPLLWMDFEEAMNHYELLDIHRRFFQGKDDGLYDEETFRRVVNRINPTLNNIHIFLRQWIEGIDVTESQKRLRLDVNSLYFSFNYTMLLERFYAIPDNRIVHIHNSLKDDDSLITGHKNRISEYEAESQCSGINEEQSTQLIAQEMNKLVKPVKQLIEQHHDFFKSLNGISNVVVFGHSLSAIDIPYITEIQKNIQEYSHWYYFGKDDASIIKYKDYVKQFNNRKIYQITSYGFTEDQLYKKMMTENCKYIITEKLKI